MVPTLVLVPTWSLPGPYVFLILSIWSQHCPYELLMRSQHGPTWSQHGLYGPYKVPTRSWSIWSLLSPYLVHTWYLYGSLGALKKNLDHIDSRGGSAHAVMYDRKGFCLQLGEKLLY
jgi:hypothetical protein